MWGEFKPAIRFVLIFVGFYLAGNLIYGGYISYKGKEPDEITLMVAKQTAWLLRHFGDEVNAIPNPAGPTVFIKSGENTVLNIYEGCNGINVFIVFAAFIIAFRGSVRKTIRFIPLGILILYASNLVRIILLYWTAISYHRYFYYVHKYIFTGVLYVVVFVLWIIWVNQFNGGKKIIAAE
jgi:exosortase family protein XrtF